MSNLLDDPNTSYNNLADNTFTSSAAFSKALGLALNGQTMEVYDSFDRANFEVDIESFLLLEVTLLKIILKTTY